MGDVDALKAEVARLERRVAELEGRASASSTSREWAPSVALSEELELLLSELSDYVWSAQVVDGEFRYRYYSPVVEQITGRPPAFFLAGAGAWLSTIHPDDVEHMMAAAQKVLSGEVPVIEESYRVIKPDGEERWVRDRAMRVERTDGTVRINGIVRDVTDQVRAEARTRALQDRLQARQSARAGGLSVRGCPFSLARSGLARDDLLADREDLAGPDPRERPGDAGPDHGLERVEDVGLPHSPVGDSLETIGLRELQSVGEVHVGALRCSGCRGRARSGRWCRPTGPRAGRARLVSGRGGLGALGSGLRGLRCSPWSWGPPRVLRRLGRRGVHGRSRGMRVRSGWKATPLLVGPRLLPDWPCAA